jgi:hypothetical protein
MGFFYVIIGDHLDNKKRIKEEIKAETQRKAIEDYHKKVMVEYPPVKPKPEVTTPNLLSSIAHTERIIKKRLLDKEEVERKVACRMAKQEAKIKKQNRIKALLQIQKNEQKFRHHPYRTITYY